MKWLLLTSSAKPFILKYCQISCIKMCSITLLVNLVWEKAYLSAKEKIPRIIENYFFLLSLHTIYKTQLKKKLTYFYYFSFSWTRNGTHFDIDKDAQVTMKPNSGTLVINIVNGGKAEAYEGVYQCTARNERGAAISNNIVIRPSSK